jgi:uncharacterized protein (DUF169 family)
LFHQHRTERALNLLDFNANFVKVKLMNEKEDYNSSDSIIDQIQASK